MQPGARLGPYEVLTPLGAGGMGEVYRARDTRLGREVAIKVLPAEFTADPERLRRFEQEARAASALNHPNVVVVFDVGTAVVSLRGPKGAEAIPPDTPGLPRPLRGLAVTEGAGEVEVHYLVEELLEGESLREWLKGGALPARKAMELAGQVAAGLAAAHEKGIVHRDLKPENLFVTKDGHVKILDFGIAKLLPKRQQEPGEPVPTVVDTTEPGVVLGTAAYMSPEQVRGQSADARSDIFSFGCVLFEMVTGRPAFARDTGAETMTAILKEEPPEASKIEGSVPPALSRSIAHCLEKRPEERFQSARDLAFDLRAIATDTGGTQTTPMLAGPAGRKRLLWLAAGAVGVLVVAVGAFFLMRGRATETGPVLEPKRIVVAVFENQTGDKSLDPLGRMASDWITQGLSQIASIEAVPTSAAIHAEQAAQREGGSGRLKDPLRALAEETGAGLVVSGTYYLQGGSLQLQARVTEAVQGTLLYAVEPVSGARTAPMPALDTLRQRVMGAVAAHVGPSSMRSPLLSRPPLFDSYREYVAGLELFGDDYAQSVRHFEKAAEIDPDFLSPQIYIAVAYGNQGDHARADTIIRRLNEKRERFTPLERHMLDWFRATLAGHDAEALQEIRRALELVPKSGTVNYLFGLTSRNLNLPQQTVDTFAKLTPEGFLEVNTITGSWRFNVLTQAHHMLADYTRELEVAEQAIRVLPDVLTVRAGKVRALVALGRLDEVDRVIEESLAVQSRAGTPGDLMLGAARELRAHGHRARSLEMTARAVDWLNDRSPAERAKEEHRRDMADALYAAERWDEAQAIFEELAAQHPVASSSGASSQSRAEREGVPGTLRLRSAIDYLGSLGCLAARRGDRAGAQRISDELAAIDQPFLFGRHAYWRACITALLGDKQGAVDLLRESFAQGDEYGVYLHRDIDLEPLWDYPPFIELLRPKG